MRNNNNMQGNIRAEFAMHSIGPSPAFDPAGTNDLSASLPSPASGKRIHDSPSSHQYPNTHLSSGFPDRAVIWGGEWILDLDQDGQFPTEVWNEGRCPASKMYDHIFIVFFNVFTVNVGEDWGRVPSGTTTHG